MRRNETVTCRISYFICANLHASSLEHTKVNEVEKSDNHCKKRKKNRKKNKTPLVQDSNNAGT